MKPGVLLLPLFTLWWLAPAPGMAQGIQNPSFEEEATDQGLALEWDTWGVGLERKESELPARTGRYTIVYDHSVSKTNQTSGFQQDLTAAKAGTRYRFAIHAAMIRAERGQRSFQAVQIRLESTVNERQVILATRSFTPRQITADKQWSKLRVEGTAATDSLRVVVSIEPASQDPRGGRLRFEDASLEILSAGGS